MEVSTEFNSKYFKKKNLKIPIDETYCNSTLISIIEK